MRILKHTLTGLMIAATGMAFFAPSASPEQALEHSAQAWQCADLGFVSWQEMDGAQRRLAAACDQAEAEQNWVLAYGGMNTEVVAEAIVHEPY